LLISDSFPTYPIYTVYHNTYSNTSLGIILRLGLLEKTEMDYKLTFFFFGEAITIFLLVTVIFDFLLIYGKAALTGMHRRMLIHHKLRSGGKEETKEETN
jgi:fumarate reductase subunit D